MFRLGLLKVVSLLLLPLLRQVFSYLVVADALLNSKNTIASSHALNHPPCCGQADQGKQEQEESTEKPSSLLKSIGQGESPRANDEVEYEDGSCARRKTRRRRHFLFFLLHPLF